MRRNSKCPFAKRMQVRARLAGDGKMLRVDELPRGVRTDHEASPGVRNKPPWALDALRFALQCRWCNYNDGTPMGALGFVVICFVWPCPPPRPCRWPRGQIQASRPRGQLQREAKFRRISERGQRWSSVGKWATTWSYLNLKAPYPTTFAVR